MNIILIWVRCMYICYTLFGSVQHKLLIIIEQKPLDYDIESCDAKGVFWEYFFFLNNLENLFCVSTEALSHKIRMQIVSFASDVRSQNNPFATQYTNWHFTRQ